MDINVGESLPVVLCGIEDLPSYYNIIIKQTTQILFAAVLAMSEYSYFVKM